MTSTSLHPSLPTYVGCGDCISAAPQCLSAHHTSVPVGPSHGLEARARSASIPVLVSVSSTRLCARPQPSTHSLLHTGRLSPTHTVHICEAQCRPHSARGQVRCCRLAPGRPDACCARAQAVSMLATHPIHTRRGRGGGVAQHGRRQRTMPTAALQPHCSLPDHSAVLRSAAGSNCCVAPDAAAA